jgi:hypothetical protein
MHPIRRVLIQGSVAELRRVVGGGSDASDQRRALGTPEAGAGSMTDIPRKPFGGKGTMDGYWYELCGAWVEYRNLSKVLAHEGPLPHVDQDRPAVGDRTDGNRKKPPPG